MSEAIIWAFICAILVGLIEEVLRRNWPTIVRWWKILTTMIEIVIYARSEPAQKELLRDVLGKARNSDEILFVGRTHRGLLNNSKDVAAMVEAIKRGVVLKLLFLDAKALWKSPPGAQIDLRSLQLPDAAGLLAHDLGTTEAKLANIRQRCTQDNFPGSLLVYRTDLLVQSSIIVHIRSATRLPVRFLYDFSFGEEESDKFVQYYKPHRKQKPSDFCSRLYKFYDRMFGADVSSFDFALSYRPSDNLQNELARLAKERWSGFVNAHSESEAIRDNALIKILPSAAHVFSAIRHAKDAPPPVSVQIELTNVCSTSCKHCLRYTPTSLREMDGNMAGRLLDQLSDFGVRTVTFSGGEPTLHSQFVQLLSHASRKNLPVGVLSNGVGLSDQVLEAIHSNARWLRLSIDGSNSAVYGAVRRSLIPGQDAFEDLMFTLQRFKALNDKAERCKLAICYTIQKNNAHNVADMIRMVQEQGVPGGHSCLTFKFAHGRNGFLCTDEQMRDLQKLFSDPDFEHKANLDYLKWFVERQSSTRDVMRGRPTENFYLRQDTRCFTPHLFALVDPQGDVYPCCFLFEDNKNYTQDLQQKRQVHCLGNVGREEFKEIWIGKKYREVRDELRVINPSDKHNKYQACGECTRHCNHNRWLSKLYQEYNALHAIGGNGDAVMQQLSQNSQSDEIWL